MVTRLPSASIFRFWACLLLATIGLQALIPIGSPLNRSSGPVFSADTFEVTIAPQRQSRRDSALVPLPLDPGLAQHAHHALARPATLAGSAPFGIASGPPEHSLYHWRYAARAPPTA